MKLKQFLNLSKSQQTLDQLHGSQMIDYSWLTKKPIAHCGYHNQNVGLIENTASAFAAALKNSFSIECDVQISADGEAMVFHDFALERLTQGHGLLKDKTRQELQTIPFHETNDRMQTLGELLNQIAGRQSLIVEIKSDWKDIRKLTQRVADLATQYKGPIALMSFDPKVIQHLRYYAPNLTRGIVAKWHYNDHGTQHFTSMQRFQLRHVLHVFQSHPHFIAYDINNIPAIGPWILQKGFKLPLLTWTVRTKEQRKKAAHYAEQIIFEGFHP